MEKLKALFSIQKVLQAHGYNDISRISNEIYDFSIKSNTPLSEILSAIATEKPWEYIKEEAEFKGNIFKVNSSTLIPRIETEILVNIAKNEIEKGIYTDAVDVGTGSGCIIISLLDLLSSLKLNLYATDISKEALDTAKQNEQNILGKNTVKFLNTNLLENISFSKDANVLITANLPYIPTNIYEQLDSSVKDFEPKTALDGGKDGLKYYKLLFEQILNLKLNCTVILEVEPSTLASLLYLNPEVIQDQYGENRFLVVRFS